ncbi:MAG: DUF3267 domain-containing protein [Clostridiales bacterium]|nr:DUF3267 domain-containing protein [Clostridiales bacterium]
MKTFHELPSGYIGYFALDLQNNKKTMLLVNLLAALIAIVMVVFMHFYVPVFTFFNAENGIILFWVKSLFLLAMIIAYMFLHELIHGIAMKICGTKKVSYGFTGIYAYAGSADYYGKATYIFIALAPVAVFLILLTIVNFFVPLSCFWTIYLIQVVNVSGAAGDIYITCKLLRMPKNILIKDAGISMMVYIQQ